jgi:hypothetical protein
MVRPKNIWKRQEEITVVYVFIYVYAYVYVGIRHADHVALSIRTSWQSLRRQAAVSRSV